MLPNTGVNQSNGTTCAVPAVVLVYQHPYQTGVDSQIIVISYVMAVNTLRHQLFAWMVYSRLGR